MSFDELLAECVAAANTEKPGIPLDMLPSELRGYAAEFLPISGQSKLGRTSKELLAGFEDDLAGKLKPGLTGNPATLFQDPKNRLDQYVPIDLKGVSYLNSIGIINPVWIAQIKKGTLTIQGALDRIVVNQQVLNAALQGDDISQTEREELTDLTDYLLNGLLTINEALQLDSGQVSRLSSAHVKMFISNGLLSQEKALSLTHRQAHTLWSKNTQKYIANGMLSMDRALDLTDSQRANLWFQCTQKYLDNGTFSLDEALNLTDQHRTNLWFESVQKYVDNGMLPMDRALNLTDNQRTNILSENVQKHIDNRLMDMDAALSLSALDRNNLPEIA